MTRFVKCPKYPGSISTSMGTLTVGRPRRLPMASAISRNGIPPSCDRVPIFAGRTLLQRQAEQGGDIADVHGAPQVRAVSGVAGEALLLRERDQPREEAGTIGRAVRDEGKPHDRRPHSLLGEADYGAFHDVTNTQGALVLIAAGQGRVLLGGRSAQVPGRADAARRDQRLSGSRECLAVREHDLGAPRRPRRPSRRREAGLACARRG